MFAYWKHILAFAGLSVICELLYIAFKEIQNNSKYDINEFIAFNDRVYDCKNKLENKCNDPSCRRHNFNRIIESLESAKVSIDLCFYILSCSDIVSAIIKAYRRGVNIRVIIQPNMNFTHNSKFMKIYDEGIPTRWKQNAEGIMHHKFCIIDGSRRVSELNKLSGTPKSKPLYRNGLVMTGSMNWTDPAVSGNWESIILTTEENIVVAFEDMFQQIWDDFEIETTNSSPVKHVKPRKK